MHLTIEGISEVSLVVFFFLVVYKLMVQLMSNGILDLMDYGTYIVMCMPSSSPRL